jgi:hypothetical protein
MHIKFVFVLIRKNKIHNYWVQRTATFKSNNLKELMKNMKYIDEVTVFLTFLC